MSNWLYFRYADQNRIRFTKDVSYKSHYLGPCYAEIDFRRNTRCLKLSAASRLKCVHVQGKQTKPLCRLAFLRLMHLLCNAQLHAGHSYVFILLKHFTCTTLKCFRFRNYFLV